MILPFFDGLRSFKAAPVTWSLFILQVAVFVFGWWIDLNLPTTDDFFKASFFKTQGTVYAQYLQAEGENRSQLVNHLAKRVANGASLKSELLGHMALRDQKFLRRAPALELDGDQVALQSWRNKLNDWKIRSAKLSSTLLGLQPEDQVPQLSWLSYLFAHGSLTHFVGNMIFFLILGIALEPLIGGLGLAINFLLFGVLSAVIFLAFSPSVGAPLVGASGGVSGMMMLTCILYRGHWPVRFIYWLLLPFKGFTGFIYLPAIFLAVLWVIADLAGHLSTPADFGGVAHIAHFGGVLGGLIVGTILLMLNPNRGREAKEDKECYELIPLI